MKALNYRPDIDGLRAVAVLSVVLYHAFPSLLPGGFIGVDVFFVISGYLISLIILGNLKRGSFSLLEFYVRRVIRIFPALVIVLGATFSFGWLCLLPDEFSQLARHTVGAAFFVVNFILWSEVGYFDTAAALKPLLHLWSLAIEEQFYLVWPLLTIGAHRLRAFPLVLAILAAASFCYCLMTSLGPAPEAAFYSPLARFWELLAGCGLAWLTLNSPASLRRQPHAQSIIGAGLLAIGIAAITQEDSFPGFWALLPVAGAFFLISAGPMAIVNRSILSSRPLVMIGLISYPLYLWHWPLLSFARILSEETLSSAAAAVLVVTSFALAWATYAFIERPIRASAKRSIYALCAAAAMSVVALLGAVVMHLDGMPSRSFIAGVVQPPSFIDKVMATYKSRCPFSVGDFDGCYRSPGPVEINTILIGDSHAGHLVPSLLEKTAAEAFILNGGCPPAYGVERMVKGSPGIMSGSTCQSINEARLDSALRSAAKNIIFSVVALEYNDNRTTDKYSYRGVMAGNHDAFAAAFRDTVSRFIKAGKAVFIVGDNPRFQISAFKLCQVPDRPFSFGAARGDTCSIPRGVADAQNSATLGLYAQIADEFPGQVHVFHDADVLCSGTGCPVRREGKSLYRDFDHLSLFGSRLVVDALLARFPELR